MSKPEELEHSNEPSAHRTGGLMKGSKADRESAGSSTDEATVDLPKGQKASDERQVVHVHTDPPPPPFASPPETYQRIVAGGKARAAAPWTKTFYLGLFAGFYLSFGGALSLKVGGNMPGIAESNPGLQSLFGALFGLPTFLTIIVCTGAELFTANCMFMTTAVVERACGVVGLIKNWVMSYFGNLIGSLIMAGLFKATGLFSDDTTPVEIAIAKSEAPWDQTLVRAILCNWLVCIAIWLANAGNTLTQKVLGVFLPISAFVAIGLEHCIANMFTAPLGLIIGHGSTGDWIVYNLIPVTLGNIISGVFVVGLGYALMFGKPKAVWKF